MRGSVFFITQPGCIIDGSVGHGYVRERLADILGSLGYSLLADELRAPMSDDASEEDEALEILTEHAVPGLRVEFFQGDVVAVEDTWEAD